jgi:arylsulfatase A-like enzyme
MSKHKQKISIWIYILSGLLISLTISCKIISKEESNSLPNIILIMADDLGWGDVSYNGNPIVKTPHLDSMAKSAIKFDRFYAAAPVCSPTRASCLTGRHPYRMNIRWAGNGFMLSPEITIAEALKTKNYATGHFGKWHVGGLSKTVKQSYFEGPFTTYSPPWENGFDECFSTESMMPTYNPYYQVGGAFGSSEYRFIQDIPIAYGQKEGGFRWRDYYWEGQGRIVDEWLEGDDSKIIMDRALKFIKRQVEKENQFLSVIWFHTPHTPVVAGKEDRSLYSNLDDIKAQHWNGSISAMDSQIGRLRSTLKELKVDRNTIVWFCSDNGPSYIHDYNSAGGFKGKKSELFEGGIRVPALLEWPAKFENPRSIVIPCVTSDFYPTILNICNITIPNQPTLDGEDLLPILLAQEQTREQYIGFQSPLPNRHKKQETSQEEQFAVQGEKLKLISMDNGASYQLFDMENDPGEKIDVSKQNPEVVSKMIDFLNKWKVSCRESAHGKDY